MCVEVDLALTEACRRDLHEAGGSCTVYKYLAIRQTDRELTSPSMRDFVWRPGWSQAEGRPPAALEDGRLVGESGFHVFLDRSRVPGQAVEFLALEKDFVCAGRWMKAGSVHAVFRRLHLSEESYLRAFRQEGCAPPPQRLACGQRVLREVEWEMLASWVALKVATGSIQRALVDVTARDPLGPGEPTDPVVWVRQPGPTGPRRVRGSGVRAIPIDSVLAATSPSNDPPVAA